MTDYNFIVIITVFTLVFIFLARYTSIFLTKLPKDPLEKLVKSLPPKWEWAETRRTEKEVDLFTWDISIFQKSGNIILCQKTDELLSYDTGGHCDFNSHSLVFSDKHSYQYISSIAEYVSQVRSGYITPTNAAGVSVLVSLDTLDRIEYKKSDLLPTKAIAVSTVSKYVAKDAK